MRSVDGRGPWGLERGRDVPKTINQLLLELHVIATEGLASAGLDHEKFKNGSCNWKVQK